MITVNKKLKNKINRTRGEKILFTIVFIWLCIHAATFIYAYSLTIINTFKDPFEYALGNTYKFPEKWLWKNYGEVFKVLEVNDTGYFGMIINTIWQTALGTLVPMVATIMASYAYSRYAFPGRKAVYFIAIVLLTLSFPGSLPATYKLYADLGLRNSPLFYLGATAGLGTNFIVLCGFWNSVSWDYAHAANIDGANEFTTMVRVILPQALPILGIMLLLGFMAGWTDSGTSMMFLPEYPTVAYGLFAYEKKMTRNMNYPVYFAGLVLTAIPSIVLYVAFQDVIMTGMNIGGLKG